MRGQTLTLSIEVLGRRALILERAVSSSHTITGVVGSLHWTTSHVEGLLLVTLALLGVAQSGAPWRLTNFHSW